MQQKIDEFDNVFYGAKFGDIYQTRVSTMQAIYSHKNINGNYILLINDPVCAEPYLLEYNKDGYPVNKTGKIVDGRRIVAKVC